MENIDQKISSLFNVVQLKREAVAKAEENSKKSWLTNCSLTINGESQPKNLQTANEKSVQSILTFLLMNRQFVKQAADLLGLDFDDQYNTYSYDDWITDCQKRISIIKLKAQKDNLNEMETRLNAIVSPEQRRAMELEAISKSLGI